MENYNENVTFIGGIQPPTASNSGKMSVLSMHGLQTSPTGKKGGRISVKLDRVRNCTIGNFNGKFGVALYKDGEMVRTLEVIDVSLTPTRSYLKPEFNPILPNNLSGQDYQLVMVSKANDDTQWRPILTSEAGCIDLEVKGDNVTLKLNNFDRYIDLGDQTATAAGKKDKKDKKEKKELGKSVTTGLGDVEADDFYGN